jgi:hypothetical protein
MGRLGHGRVKLLDLDALLMRGDRENQLPSWLNRLVTTIPRLRPG